MCASGVCVSPWVSAFGRRKDHWNDVCAEGKTAVRVHAHLEAKAMSSIVSEQDYRFTRDHFGPLPLSPLHYDLHFHVEPAEVTVVATQTYLVNESASKLVLNAHNLTVESVELISKHSLLGPPPVGLDAAIPDFVAHVASFGDAAPVAFEVQKEERFLVVTLPREAQKGQELVIRTRSKCFPNEKCLEGIYFDFTPEGCPQQLITQCQQYGFQRIVPCVDRMASKTFYTTTIVADAKYTNLVSNGDVAPEYMKDGEPSFKPMPGGKKEIKYYNHTVNMAPYLFFLCCGTYDVYKQELEYADGDTCMLELLCLPKVVQPQDARTALQALHDSIIWLHLSCGPEATMHNDERARMYALVKEREELKRMGTNAGRLTGIRAELRELCAVWQRSLGYKYTGTVYREIAMENSNYGGMENVGNTTIISSRLTPSKWLTDGGYVYMEGVKIHEFYHNINGSQVTGASPFEIWLNEAVTVHVQRQRENELFGSDYMRLREVMYCFVPATGPLAADRSPQSMAVEPVGFNTTHELISAMTYTKAPEFVRMVESILGSEKFNLALHTYHTRYAYSNATSDQWIACMAEQAPANVDLVTMAQGWLKRTGYPTVSVESAVPEGNTLVVTVTQSGFENHAVEAERYPWVVPIAWAVVQDGQDVVSGLFILDKTSDIIRIDFADRSAPSLDECILSVGRDFSFFGDVNMKCITPKMRIAQALGDTDAVNRYLAYRTIVDDEKAALIEGTTTAPSGSFLALFGTVLNDANMAPATKALLLMVEESVPSRPDLSHLYQEIADAKDGLLSAAYQAHGDTIVHMYDALAAASKDGPQKEGLVFRPLKSLLLGILCYGGFNKLEAAKRALSLLQNSTFMSDRSSAFVKLLNLSAEDESLVGALNLNEVFQSIKMEWTAHPIGCEAYISAICQTDCCKSPVYIRELVNEPFFQIQLAGHARSVARGWSKNRKRSLMTDDGLALTIELFFKIGKINQMSAYAFLSAFGDFKKFEGDKKARLVAAMKTMRDGLDEKLQESLHKQLGVMLKGC